MRVHSEARASQRDNYATRAEARLAQECLAPVLGIRPQMPWLHMPYADENAQASRKDIDRVWGGFVA